MEKYAQIPFIPNGVVFSDPHYNESVWCQYRKDFRADNWLMKMESKTEDKFISFVLTLGRSTVLSSVETKDTLDGLQINYPARYDTQAVQLGMDTAKIFCGLQNAWETHSEEAAIRTGTDGLFGDLMVFTCKGEQDPSGFLLIAGVEEIFMDENELFRHLVSSFSGLEISKEQFTSRINPNALEVKLLTASEVRHASDSFPFGHRLTDKENER